MKYGKQVFAFNSCSFLRLLFFTLFFLSEASYSCQNGSDDKIEQLSAQMARISLDAKDEYYSDSEDEEGYQYKGFASLPKMKKNTSYVLLSRGIHYSPDKFSREQISIWRRENKAGKGIYAPAAYALSHKDYVVEQDDAVLLCEAQKIKKVISGASKEERNKFQKCYVNNYEQFHQHLQEEDGLYNKLRSLGSTENPHVSTSEDLIHSGKYAAGLKFKGLLKPEYDKEGKPKHPYLGKLFVILIPKERVSELDPFFVACAHANKEITISTHFSNNILSEREVTFPGLIPGDCVVLSVDIRVPSFKGEYKEFYKKKYGITKESYNSRKKILKTGTRHLIESTPKTLLVNRILPHVKKTLEEHVRMYTR